jgi:hypothetical protein
VRLACPTVQESSTVRHLLKFKATVNSCLIAGWCWHSTYYVVVRTMGQISLRGLDCSALSFCPPSYRAQSKSKPAHSFRGHLPLKCLNDVGSGEAHHHFGAVHQLLRGKNQAWPVNAKICRTSNFASTLFSVNRRGRTWISRA